MHHMAGQRPPFRHAAGTSTSRPPLSAAGADDDTYGSSSTLSTETSTGFQVLDVSDYATTKAYHAAGGEPLQSKTFKSAGCSWRIIFSTHGSSADTLDWICFGLRCLEPPAAGTDLEATMVRTSYCLLDHARQQPVPSTVKTDSVRALSTMTRPTRMPFMKRQRFEASSYLKDDKFIVRCDVSVVTCSRRVSGVLPPPDLRRHLGDLLASGVGADVTVEVGGEAFTAHRSVLAARSPVFRAELLGGVRDEEDAAAVAATTTNRVMRIGGVEPSVFKALLHFVYTDSLPEIDAGEETVMARRLLAAAERFGLQGLKWICEDILWACSGDEDWEENAL